MAEAPKVPIRAETTKETRPPAAGPGGWTPLDSLRREIDRIFDTFRHGTWELPFGRRAFELELPWPREGSWGLSPAVDFADKDKEFEITAELPGMDEKDIEVKLVNDTLTIKGEKKEEKEKREQGYFFSERRYGSFIRTFQVPAGVDTAKIEAAFSKGVLTVKLPKIPEAQTSEKTISIKTK
jgi:HSP20 family protein